MPGLHEELTGGGVAQCRLCQFLRSLSLIEAAEWKAELREPVSVIAHVSVVNALARRGVDITETSVRRHRARHAK